MSVLWIVEKQSSEHSASAALLGDFAVRLFSSLPSFIHLLKFRKHQKPDLVLIDLDECPADTAKTESLLEMHLPEVRRIFLSQDAQVLGLDSRSVFFRKPIEPLMLSAFVRRFLSREAPGTRRRALRCRDLVLDVDRLEFRIDGGKAAEKLPLKEAQILKLLLEHKGICISREVIKAEIWNSLSVSMRTIDSHVSRLRKRLNEFAPSSVTIESVYGGGYTLK